MWFHLVHVGPSCLATNSSHSPPPHTHTPKSPFFHYLSLNQVYLNVHHSSELTSSYIYLKNQDYFCVTLKLTETHILYMTAFTRLTDLLLCGSLQSLQRWSSLCPCLFYHHSPDLESHDKPHDWNHDDNNYYCRGWLTSVWRTFLRRCLQVNINSLAGGWWRR